MKNHMRNWLSVLVLTVMFSGILSLASQVLKQEAVAYAASPWPDWSIVFVAHRGNVPGYPENTLAAFRQAIKLGAEVIEVDLRGTKDGNVVIMHDSTIDRTTNGTGYVTDFTLAELKTFDAGNGERIPTFEETLQVVAGTGVKLLLDIKETPGLNKEKVVRLIEKHGAIMNVIVGPRNIADLNTFMALNPNLRSLGFIPKIEDIDAFASAGIGIIRLWPHWITADPTLVKKVHDLNRPVWSTVNDEPRENIEAYIRLGVNGILSDLPDVMAAIIKDMNESRGWYSYVFTSIFPPFNNLPALNKVQAGSAVPVKFSLTGDQGLAIFAAGYPKSEQISCLTSSPEDESEATVTAGSSGLFYDLLADTYSYVWKTSKGWAGTCRQLSFMLKDGTLHQANFQFAK